MVNFIYAAVIIVLVIVIACKNKTVSKQKSEIEKLKRSQKNFSKYLIKEEHYAEVESNRFEKRISDNVTEIILMDITDRGYIKYRDFCD